MELKMKLSEILKDWPEKRISLYPPDEIDTINFSKRDRDIYNAALTSCDREIDREALANVLYKICIMTESHSNRKVDYFIATMPTWLKRIER